MKFNNKKFQLLLLNLIAICLVTMVACRTNSAVPTLYPEPTIKSIYSSPISQAVSEPMASATPIVISTPTTSQLIPAGAGLVLPANFKANVFLTGLTNPTSLAVSHDGVVYVSQENGTIVAVIDIDLDGKADAVKVFAEGFISPLGLAYKDDSLYVSSRGSVTRLIDADGDTEVDEIKAIISGLPNGIHQNNGLVFGPDDMIYLTVGSTCNACIEEDERSATIMQFQSDGTNGEIYANGLRNVYDLAFHPVHKALFAADNGRDENALNVPEELNLIEQGDNYGWPNCWGINEGSDCVNTVPPIAEFEPRASANGLIFYTGSMFPEEFTNDLFVALWGSHSREKGRKIVRVRIDRDKEIYTAKISDFAFGIDRPLDLVQAADGALLILDHSSGTIYRVYWIQD